MSTFARPFRITASGRDDLDGRHGVQFPSGICVLDVLDRWGMTAATGLEHLELPADAAIEWLDDPAKLRAAVLAACDATEDAYAGEFHEGPTADLGLIRAAAGSDVA